MSQIMANCGLLCNECPSYIATINNDDELRKKTAEEWSRMYGGDIKPDDINCRGCNSDLLFSHCNDCEIRACSMEKEYENCSKCDTFPCSKLDPMLGDPAVKKRLEALRN